MLLTGRQTAQKIVTVVVPTLPHFRLRLRVLDRLKKPGDLLKINHHLLTYSLFTIRNLISNLLLIYNLLHPSVNTLQVLLHQQRPATSHGYHRNRTTIKSTAKLTMMTTLLKTSFLDIMGKGLLSYR
jgi:hypothetical protein